MAEQNSEKLSRKERLAARTSYQAVYRSGKKIKGKYVYFYFLANDVTYARLGVTASRKTGPPVVRNRIKRRLKEIFRKNKGSLRGVDIVINARRRASRTSYSCLNQDFKNAIRQWNFYCGAGPEASLRA